MNSLRIGCGVSSKVVKILVRNFAASAPYFTRSFIKVTETAGLPTIINKKRIEDKLLMDRQRRSRGSSIASINELVGDEEDLSLFRAGEFVQLSACEDKEFIANAYKYCQRCIAGSWAKCSADKFNVQFLSGGMTNYLYLCSLNEDVVLEKNEPRKVLIRIHGNIIDQKQRFYEGVVFTLLSERGYGPKTFGIFYSGRIEEFIPHRPLFQKELSDPAISKLIAQKAGEYHCMKLPLNKNPTCIWENIEKYLDMVDEIERLSDDSSQRLFESVKKDFNLRGEYDWLRTTLTELNSPVVFCHNDLHEGNILFIDKKPQTDITLIDYDYSSYNYRGYEIGNHFCEWMYEYTLDGGGDGFAAYFDKYPTKEQQELFATEYLSVLLAFKQKMVDGDYDYQRFTSNIDVCTVDQLLHEGNTFTLASHFYWGLWSIVQVQISKIRFGYMKYARSRFDAYIKQKKELGY